jgi:hypothetical protein
MNHQMPALEKSRPTPDVVTFSSPEKQTHMQEGPATPATTDVDESGDPEPPTLEQIEELCAQFRQRWSAKEELQRRVGRHNQRLRVEDCFVKRLDTYGASRRSDDDT